MNKEIFTDICDRLESEVTALNWIDFDAGQLETERPGITYPAALIDIEFPSCDDIGYEQQQAVIADINIRLIFKPNGATNSRAPVPVRDEALSFFDTVQNVHLALQEWDDNYQLTPFSRTRVLRERRNDGLTVYRATYRTGFREIP